MDKNLVETLFTACPVIFRDREKKSRLLKYGVETSDGWYPIIYDLSMRVELIAKALKDEGKTGIQLPLVDCIKQDMGELRYYMSNTSLVDKELDELIKNAQQQASTTCEVCGANGVKKSMEGYVIVICNECEKMY